MRKVLVVDDDMFVRNFLKILFEGNGFAVSSAKDGRVAVREAEIWMLRRENCSRPSQRGVMSGANRTVILGSSNSAKVYERNCIP